MIYELWDVGEEIGRSAPNLTATSVGRVMRALLLCNGTLRDYALVGSGTDTDRNTSVVYRIALPVGSKERFEELARYPLTRPMRINGS
jgi:hypothetical protein